MSGANESAVELAHARVGKTLHDKWRLDALLGVGGMAAVYAATHRNGARAAIKMLHLAVSLDAEARRRFLREGYVANAVGHPGAVRVLDDDVAEDGSAYLVMELLEGDSLDTLAERRGGKLPPGEVLGHTVRLLEVLVAAHQKGIVHRDIKPDNVFVTRDGTLKLLDFGIARMRDGGGVSATADGAAFGTPAFMAPEQALGRVDEIDARTDLFSVGATMFSLLTGRFVHVTRTLPEQLVAQATQPAPAIGGVMPGVPAAVAAVVDRALAFDRVRRWPDARAMREAIHRAMEAPGNAAAIAPLEVVGAGPRPLPSALAATVPPSVNATAKPASGRSTIFIGFVAGMACVAGAVFLLRAGMTDRRSHDAPRSASSAPAVEPQPAPARETAQPTPPAPPPPASAAPPATSASAPASASPPADTPPHTAHNPPKPPPSEKPPKAAPGPKKAPDDSWLDRQH